MDQVEDGKWEMKLNYFTEEESTYRKDLLFSQGTLGLKSCKTISDVNKIFEDIWKIAQHRKRKRKR